MIFFNACPKCQGDMHSDSDIYSAYICCVNCGRYVDIEVDPRVHVEQQQPRVLRSNGMVLNKWQVSERAVV